MKRALLCVCPPYPVISPPAGAAALLGYLKSHGIEDFGFVDLRLGTPSCYEATYSATGVFGESFVMDIPDLPLVLQLLAAADSNRPYQIAIDDLIEARHPRGQLRQWPIRTAPRSRTSSTRGPGAASNERACIDEAFAPEAGKAAPVRYCHSRGQFQLLRLSCSSSIRPSAPRKSVLQGGRRLWIRSDAKY